VKLTTLDWIALILLIIGGINWLLVGIAGVDVVAAIFGDMSVLSRIIYILVGLTAIYLLFISRRLGKTTPRGAAV
jgi:uncharacterized membrane protein YuzA (DUF378 family)